MREVIDSQNKVGGGGETGGEGGGGVNQTEKLISRYSLQKGQMLFNDCVF